MKEITILIVLFCPVILTAQIGIKAGVNFAKVSSTADINSSRQSGFHAGIFLAPPSKKIISSKTEFLFSRQGYNYKTNSSTGNIKLDYFTQAQFICINLTKFVQLQFGAQTAILLSAGADTTNTSGTANPYGKIMDLYNRFDYGYALGVEIHPVAGLIIGARYNVSLAKVYKDLQSLQKPSFTSEDAKNNVVQISVGWRFGKQSNDSKKQNK
jgi:opacity protein-like surface antigen